MNTLQQQDNIAVSAKIDALHLIVEQLNNKVSSLLEVHGFDSHTHISQEGIKESNFTGGHELTGHHDVLEDSIHPNLSSHTGEKQLGPDIQIQRLTAQLTAAYNRIAALEEQLLARRNF